MNTVSDPHEAKILEFCNVPRSRNELEELLAGKMTISYAMEKYIKPMVENGRLALTIPDKPRSKYQKYYTIKKTK